MGFNSAFKGLMIPYQTHYFALMKNNDDSVVKTNILKYWFLNSCSCPSLENVYQKHFPIQDIETAVSYDIKKFISYPFTRYWQYYMLFNPLNTELNPICQ